MGRNVPKLSQHKTHGAAAGAAALDGMYAGRRGVGAAPGPEARQAASSCVAEVASWKGSKLCRLSRGGGKRAGLPAPQQARRS